MMGWEYGHCHEILLGSNAPHVLHLFSLTLQSLLACEGFISRQFSSQGNDMTVFANDISQCMLPFASDWAVEEANMRRAELQRLRLRLGNAKVFRGKHQVRRTVGCWTTRQKGSWMTSSSSDSWYMNGSGYMPIGLVGLRGAYISSFGRDDWQWRAEGWGPFGWKQKHFFWEMVSWSNDKNKRKIHWWISGDQ